MTSRTIGGNLDMAGNERQHAEPHHLALADARDHARRSLAALRSIEPGAMPADQYAGVGRCAALLVDMVQDLERVGRRL